jgi:hypothetical protein
MTNLLIVVAATALTLVSAGSYAQGAPIGGSTGIGSGVGIQGTGPGWSNGTNRPPQPSTYSVPPGGYGQSPQPPGGSGYAPPSFAPPPMGSSPSFR